MEARNRCKDCSHKSVCKYADAYMKIFESNEYILPKEVADVFTLSLDCKNFKQDMPVIHGGNPDNIKIALYDNKKHPCSECETYKKLLIDKIVVGDLPCNWCKNGQYILNKSFDINVEIEKTSEPKQFKTIEKEGKFEPLSMEELK